MTVGKTLAKALVASTAALAMLAGAGAAQARPGDDENPRANGWSRSRDAAAVGQAERASPRGDWSGRRGDAGGSDSAANAGWRSARPQQAAPVAQPNPQPQAAPQAAPQGRWARGDGTQWRRPDGATPNDAARPAAPPTARGWTGRGNDAGQQADWQRNRTYADQRRNETYRSDTRRDDNDRWRNGDGNDNRWRNDNRWNGNRDGRSENWQRNGGDWRRDGAQGDRRDGNGRDGNGRDWNGRDWNRDNHARWNRDWRRNDRYNWSAWRNTHRDTYRLSPYYAPYRGYSYRRFSIGLTIDSLFFSSRYWINDPWSYRLPDAYGPYRWVRYYDDALLVDIYSGQVVDVMYDFFW